MDTAAFQDCAVGLLFALLPILGGTSGALQGMVSMTKLYDNIPYRMVSNDLDLYLGDRVETVFHLLHWTSQ